MRHDDTQLHFVIGFILVTSAVMCSIIASVHYFHFLPH